MLALFAGKASVDQLARRYGVLPGTVEGWRTEALAAIEDSFRQGGKSPRERDLERENKQLHAALSDVTVRQALLERAVKQLRPSLLGRPLR